MWDILSSKYLRKEWHGSEKKNEGIYVINFEQLISSKLVDGLIDFWTIKAKIACAPEVQ